MPMGLGGALGQGLQGGMQAAQSAQTFQQTQALQALQKQLIASQIGNYTSEDMKRKADIAEQQRRAAEVAGDEQLQQQADAYARGGAPAQQPSAVAPVAQPAVTPAEFGAYKMPPNATDVHEVLPNLTAAQERAVADGKVVLGKSAQGEMGLGTPQALEEQARVAAGGPLVAPVESKAKAASIVTDPAYHERRAEFFYKNKKYKLGDDAAKQALSMRKELAGIDKEDGAAPTTKTISIGNGQEQLFEWNKNSKTWDKQGEPRPIFNPNPVALVNNYPNPMPVVDPKTGKQKLVQFKKDGSTQESTYLPAKDSTDTERLAAGFHDRMISAEKNMAEVGTKGYPTYGTATASTVLGALGERVVQSKEQQRYRQAQEDWVRAKLRKESGATIKNDEMDKEIQTYFPVVGDSKEVIVQKEGARKIATEAMKRNAGRADQPVSDSDPLGIRK